MSNNHNDPRTSDSALGLLWDVSALLADDMDRGLAARGLTRARGALLWRLYHHGNMTQRELSQALEVTPRHITTLVDELQHTGHLLRRQHPTDRRSTHVALTDQGEHLVAEMNARADHAAQDLFGDLDQAQLEGFVAILTAISHKLRASSPEPPHASIREERTDPRD